MADTYEQENGDEQFAEDTTNATFNNEQQITETSAPEETTGGEGDAVPGGAAINASKNDDDERKIFVGGLSWETTVKDLSEYFGKFGDVVDCTLKTDPTTGRSRGFGFVLFCSVECVDKVISHGSHLLHGRTIDPKRAKARGGREPIKKVFVGGLDPETPEDEIRSYFGTFGKIEEIDLPYDKQKGQRRAFCFITFESEAIVDKCCDKPKQTIGGKEVDVKKATPKSQDGYGFGGRGRGWGAGPQRGGRGRGRGGPGRGGYDNWGQGYDNYNYYNQGYGYDGYGGYGGYDNNYYNNYYNQGWPGYNQGYGTGYNTGYGGGNYGYDYNGWYGNEQGESNAQGQQQSSYGKSNRGVAKTTGGAAAGYHPYSR